MKKSELVQLMKEHKLILFYFKSSQCGACLALYPKVESILKKYPMVHLQVIQLDEEPELASFFNIYSVPAVLIYVDGKEYIKEAGIFSVQTLESKLVRLVELLS